MTYPKEADHLETQQPEWQEWLERNPESLKRTRQTFFMQIAGSVVSSLAHPQLRRITFDNHNSLLFLQNIIKSSPPNDKALRIIMFHEFGSDISKITKEQISKDITEKSTKFLAEGVEGIINDLLGSERRLNEKELSFMQNFKSLRTIEGNCYTPYGIGALIKQYFSSNSESASDNSVSKKEGSHQTG